MSHNWSPVLEVGAGWITQSKHKVFNIRSFKPKKPLDTETEWFECTINREKDELELSERDISVCIEKIKSICSHLGYTPKDDIKIKKKLNTLLSR